MAKDEKKRCRHCGGTLWLDGDIVKCFMCSRPVDQPGGADWSSTDGGRRRLPGPPDRNLSRHTKWGA